MIFHTKDTKTNSRYRYRILESYKEAKDTSNDSEAGTSKIQDVGMRCKMESAILLNFLIKSCWEIWNMYIRSIPNNTELKFL